MLTYAFVVMLIFQFCGGYYADNTDSITVSLFYKVINKKIFSEKLCERPVYYLLSPRFTRIMLCLDSILASLKVAAYNIPPPYIRLWAMGSPIARQHSAHHQTVLLGPSCIMVCEKCAQWRATCKRIFLLMFGESNDKCAYLI
ncbi:hypothetical protein HKD37_06G016446 [Glycine soja]